jgi:hypothetical protein
MKYVCLVHSWFKSSNLIGPHKVLELTYMQSSASVKCSIQHSVHIYNACIWLYKCQHYTYVPAYIQSRAIHQSDYRIAGGLFFIDTSFQVSNGVCRWSTANSPYKMAILKSRYLRKPADSAFGICKRRRRDWQSSSFKMRSAPARSLWTVSGARESQKSRQYSTKKASASSALAIHKHIGPLPCVANPFKHAPPMRAFYDDVNDFWRGAGAVSSESHT